LRCPLIAASVALTIMGEFGATWAFAQRPGHWIQEQKLVGAGAARKLASSVPPASDAAPMGRSEDRGGWARRRTAKTGVAFTPILLERPCRTRLAIARGAARNPRDSALQNCFLGHPRRWRIGLSWVSQVSPLSPSEILEPIRRQLRVAHVCWMFLCPSGVGTHSRVLCLKSGLST
jgi:hypothetical protein